MRQKNYRRQGNITQRRNRRMSEALSFSELKKTLVAEAQKRLIKAENEDPQRQRVSNAQNSNISAMTMAERRAIFEEKVNERLPEIIAKLPPRYIAKNKAKIDACHPESRTSAWGGFISKP